MGQQQQPQQHQQQQAANTTPATTDNFRVRVCFEEVDAETEAAAAAAAQAQAQAGGRRRAPEPLLLDDEDGRPLPRVFFWMQQQQPGQERGKGGGARKGRSIVKDVIPMVRPCVVPSHTARASVVSVPIAGRVGLTPPPLPSSSPRPPTNRSTRATATSSPSPP